MELVQAEKEQPGRTRPNLTGIPGGMKRDFEGRSGLSFDDVRVHYNSGAPARLGALAYTRGTQVYLGPGQERYLPHELGHVIQQKTRPVPVTQRRAAVPVNGDSVLEAEADRWARGAGPGPAAVPMFRGQDVAQCAGANQQQPQRQNWFEELYGYAAGHMPDLTGWRDLGFLENRAIVRGITLKRIAERVEVFQGSQSWETWYGLKRMLVAAEGVDGARFKELWGEQRGRDLYVLLEQLRELCDRTDKAVESAGCVQEDDDAYRDLPMDILTAKRQVTEAAERIRGDPDFYDAYFNPRLYWNARTEERPPETGNTNGSTQPASDQSSDQTSDQSSDQSSDQTSDRDADPLASWPTGRFEDDRKALLDVHRKELAGGQGHRNLADKWFALQDERRAAQPEGGVGEEEVFEETEFPWWKRLAGRFCCLRDISGVIDRFRRILQGLNWLSKNPYRKVQFYPMGADILGAVQGHSGEKSVIELWGAYMGRAGADRADIRPGTLIHEISHAFAETVDYGYDDGIKTLREGQAKNNADTYAYAAQDLFSVPRPSTQTNSAGSGNLETVPLERFAGA